MASSKKYVAKSNILGGQVWQTGAIVDSDDPYIKENEKRLLDQGALAPATKEDLEAAGYSEEELEIAEAQAEALNLPVDATPVLTTGSTNPGVGTTPGAGVDEEEVENAEKPAADVAQESVQGGGSSKGKGK